MKQKALRVGDAHSFCEFLQNKLQMSLSGTVLQICLRFTHEGKHDKKTDCKSASKRIIMMQVALPIFPVSRIRVYMHGNYSAQWYISVS